MAKDNNIRRELSYTRPILYNGEAYPSADSMISDGNGKETKGRIFADADGQYYTLDSNGSAVPVMTVNNLDEVVVTAPKENMLSKQFNDYLTNINDATYVSKPLSLEPIEPDLSFDAALKRSARTYSNYSDALDAPFSKLGEIVFNGARYIKDNYMEGLSTGASNCTLSATQWVNPANPINKAASIVREPNKYNYERIDSAAALPGDLLIAKVPNKDIYHSMMITGFADKNTKKDFKGKTYIAKEGEPLLTYSRGGNSLDNLQFNVPLSAYTENSDGHTENMFFRHIKPDKFPIFK